MNILIATALDHPDRITRFWEVLRYLSTTDHKVLIMGSGSGFAAVQEDYPDAFLLRYPEEAEDDSEFERLLWMFNRPLQGRLEQFAPQVMLWDGEPFSTHIARRVWLPVISMDPEYLYQYARFTITIPPSPFEQFMALKNKLKKRGFRAQRHLLPTFVKAKIRAQDVTLTQPIVRDEVRTATPSYGENILALVGPELKNQLKEFRTAEQPVIAHLLLERQRGDQQEHVLFERELSVSEDHTSIVDEDEIAAFEAARLAEMEEEDGWNDTVEPVIEEKVEVAPKPEEPPASFQRKIVKRRKRKLPDELNETELQSKLPPSEPGITYRVADPEAWTHDLQECKAVLSNGNATAIAEAITLKKPLLVVPKEDDFASWANAQHVEQMGFGEYHPKLTRAAIEGFLHRQDRYRAQLESYQPAHPSFYETLESQLKEVGGTPMAERKQKSEGPRGDRRDGGRRGDGGDRRGDGRRDGGNRRDGGGRRDGGDRRGGGRRDGDGRRGGSRDGDGRRGGNRDGDGRRGDGGGRNSDNRRGGSGRRDGDGGGRRGGSNDGGRRGGGRRDGGGGGFRRSQSDGNRSRGRGSGGGGGNSGRSGN